MKEIISNKVLLLFSLFFISLLLNNYTNSLLLIFTFFYAIVTIKKQNFKTDIYYFLPIFFFCLMLFSLFFTIDYDETYKSLLKELPLLIIPLIFILNNNKIVVNKKTIIKTYSYILVLFSSFFLLKAISKFFISKNTSVFFFHDLVTKELNAVHFSVFVSFAFFYFLTKTNKKTKDYFFATFLLGFLLLLSSKNIIFSTILLSGIYFFFFSKSANKMRLRNIVIVAIMIVSVFSFSIIKDRLLFEFKIKEESNIGHTVINKKEVGSNIISMKEAWYNEKFNQTDYFSGSSFRVYQTRLFYEFLKEENVFWTGFGLNASYDKIEKKGINYNIFQGNSETEGYQKKNFHNQYIQVFAELGILGFLILIIILSINLKNAIKHKDFMHIAFAVLMISLFLTESFLWRQRGVVFFTVFYCLFNSTQKNKLKFNKDFLF